MKEDRNTLGKQRGTVRENEQNCGMDVYVRKGQDSMERARCSTNNKHDGVVCAERIISKPGSKRGLLHLDELDTNAQLSNSPLAELDG